jgi:hypothetical protein
MAGRYKNLVYASRLTKATAVRPPGRPSSILPWRFCLTFGTSDGLGTLRNREIHAVISGRELAAMVAAIPAGAFTDDEDWKAALRVIDLLRSGEFNENG